MMMADISNTFGQVPNPLPQARPFSSVTRQQTTGFDVSKIPMVDLANNRMQLPVTNLPLNQMPAAFGGTGGGNTLLAAQQLQAMSTPRQSIFSNSPITASNSNFNTTSEFLNATQGSNNVARKNALNSGGPSGEIVTKARASYTGT